MKDFKTVFRAAIEETVLYQLELLKDNWSKNYSSSITRWRKIGHRYRFILSIKGTTESNIFSQF